MKKIVCMLLETMLAPPMLHLGSNHLLEEVSHREFASISDRNDG